MKVGVLLEHVDTALASGGRQHRQEIIYNLILTREELMLLREVLDTRVKLPNALPKQATCVYLTGGLKVVVKRDPKGRAWLEVVEQEKIALAKPMKKTRPHDWVLIGHTSDDDDETPVYECAACKKRVNSPGLYDTEHCKGKSPRR